LFLKGNAMKMDYYRKMWMVVSLMVILAAAMVAFGGCSKSKSAKMDTAATQVNGQAIEQKTCPVMVGTPIRKDIYTDYKGKRVYFCCPSCKSTFEKNPEKYIGSLPQFAK
jgi:hypothetical protein